MRSITYFSNKIIKDLNTATGLELQKSEDQYVLAVIIKVPSSTYHEIFQMLSATASTFQKFLESVFSLEWLCLVLKFKSTPSLLQFSVYSITVYTLQYVPTILSTPTLYATQPPYCCQINPLDSHI